MIGFVISFSYCQCISILVCTSDCAAVLRWECLDVSTHVGVRSDQCVPSSLSSYSVGEGEHACINAVQPAGSVLFRARHKLTSAKVNK